MDMTFIRRFLVAATATASFFSSPLIGAEIFVSPSGNDAADGTAVAPLRSPQAAVAKAVPGDIIHLRGGKYILTSTIVLTNSGTPGALTTLAAFGDEKPVLDFSTWHPATKQERATARGILLAGNFWHVKGLEITGTPDIAIKIEGACNVIEHCTLHQNNEAGLQIGLAEKAPNDGSLAASNLVLNCDSFHNFDPQRRGEHADGFACKLCPGKGNRFDGCRAWENSANGWNLYMAGYPVIIEHCWTWHNGDAALFGWTNIFAGEGNGFMLGYHDQPANHLVRNCIAFNNAHGDGFLDNYNSAPITVLNCTAWANGENFQFKGQPHVLRNCVSFDSVFRHEDARLGSTVVFDHNSWVADPEMPTRVNSFATRNDFLSLDTALAAAPRQPDGSLPKNNFARLKPGSALIDKGVDVGIPYTGSAPDLGAFEFQP